MRSTYNKQMNEIVHVQEEAMHEEQNMYEAQNVHEAHDVFEKQSVYKVAIYFFLPSDCDI